MKKSLALLIPALFVSGAAMASISPQGTEVGAGYTWQKYDLGSYDIDASGYVLDVEHRFGNGFFIKGSFADIEADDYDLGFSKLYAGGGIILQANRSTNIIVGAGFESQDPDAGAESVGVVDANGHYVSVGFESELAQPGLSLHGKYVVETIRYSGSNYSTEGADIALKYQVDPRVQLIGGVNFAEDFRAPYVGASYKF